MLCIFDTTGILSPIRFRIQNEDGQKQVVRVEKIIKKDIEKLAGNKMIVYTCQSSINGESRLYTIKYEIDSCKWFIYKI